MPNISWVSRSCHDAPAYRSAIEATLGDSRSTYVTSSRWSSRLEPGEVHHEPEPLGVLVDGREPVEVRVAVGLERGDGVVPLGDLDHPVRRAEGVLRETHVGGSIFGLSSEVVERL